MSQLNLNADNAIAQVRALLQELNKLKGGMTSIKGISAEAFDALTARVDALERELKQVNSAMNTVAKTAGKMQSQIAQVDRQMKKLNTTSKRYNKTSGTMFKRLRELAGAAGFAGVGYAIFRLVRNVIDLTIKFESLQFAIDKTSQQSWEAGDAMSFLMDLNNRFGAGLITTTERWLKFRTAARNTGLTLLESKNIFESVTKASAVLGLRTDELRGVYLALEQMLSKGKITTEELRRQLGERLPGAMGIMAQSMGVPISKLDEMMKKGQVLSAEVLPNFAKALEEAYGIQSLDKVENLATSVSKLTGEWQQFVKVISEGDSLLSGAIGGTLSMFERMIFNMSRLSMNLSQYAERTGTFFRGGAEQDYIDRADEIIEKNNEFEFSIDSLIKKRQQLAKSIQQTNKEGGDTTLLEKELNANQELINVYEKRRKEIMRLEAIADVPDLEASIERYENTLKSKGWFTVDFSAQVKNFLGELNPMNAKLEEQLELLTDLNPTQKGYIKRLAELQLARELAEKGTRQTPTGITGGSKSDRAIRYAKEYTETNRLLIAIEKERIKVNEDSMSKLGKSFEERSRLAKENYESELLIIDLREEDQLRANDVWLKNEKRKYDSWLSRFDKTNDKYEEQERQHKKAMTNIEKRYQDNKNFIIGDADAKRTYEILRQRQVEIDLIDTEYKLESDLLKAKYEEEFGFIQDRINRTAKGYQAERNLLDQKKIAEVNYHNEQVDLLVKRLKLRKALAGDDDKEYWQRLIDGAEATRLEFRTLEQELYHGEDAWLNWWNVGQKVVNAMGDLVDEIFNNRIVQIDKEIQAEERKYDRLLDLAKNDDDEREIIERNRQIRIEQLEEKRRKEQIRQAKFQKALSLTQAINDGAASVNAMLKAGPGLGFALASIATAISALNIATIVAQPIPAYAEGVDNLPWNQTALINEAGAQEYIERNGRIFTTNKRNAVVDLKAGDTVYPNFDEMVRRSAVYNSMVGGEAISETDFQRLFTGIEGSMKKGIKDAKFSTRVAIEKASGYKQEMSYWN